MSNFNFNKVILGGRLTADPELKTTSTGITVVTVSMAVNRRTSKEQQTDFFRVTAWRTTAEFISKYFQKGNMVCVEGSIQTRSWKDNEGNNRYATEVVVDRSYFVESKKSAQEGAAMNSSAPMFNDSPFGNLPDPTPLGTDDDLPF